MRPAREHGGRSSAGRRDDLVSDGVDASMQYVEPPDPDPIANRVPIEAELCELPAGDDAVLAPCEPRYPGVDRSR
ncbi:MAG TPA: hypothetical protein VFQ12_08145 [Thermoleophilaceae bacterium]|nr:hypothetical protein [Thermoleophilaceae bacterium]